jgi:DNA-binding MarR family transcriptional regulator
VTTARALALPAALLRSEAFLVGRLRTRLVRRLTVEHERIDLRFGHGPILICLDDAGPLSQRDLADLLGVDPSELVRHVDRLEEQRFVERQADLDDRRRKVVQITASGRAMRQRYDRMIAEVEDDMFGALSPGDRASLVQLLARLVDPA